MSETVYLHEILEELKKNACLVRDEELRAAADAILSAHRIFVAGAGRSGCAARAFSIRLMHLGLNVHFVGEPTTPAIREGDLLVIGSGSGETASLAAMAEKAGTVGADVAVITIHPESKIGQMADIMICLPGSTPKSTLKDTCRSVQVMADLFEQMSWLVYDVVIRYLIERTGAAEDEMFERHANLE